MKYTCSIERTRYVLPPDGDFSGVAGGGNTRTDSGIASVPLQDSSKVVLTSGPSEVVWHIALKILGYSLYMEFEPVIERGIGWHYKPDLISLDDDGNIRLWLDCGNIAVKKIDRVAQKVGAWRGPFRELALSGEGERLAAFGGEAIEGESYYGTPFVILKRTQRDAMLLAQALRGKVRHPERVHLLAFENGFVNTFAEHLDVTNSIELGMYVDRIVVRVVNRRGVFEGASEVLWTGVE